MTVWAIADLHLSFGVPNKEMDAFGEHWHRWTEKIQTHWTDCVASDDLVLVAGDISWAKHPDEAVPDLNWIDRLPGTKMMIKGNHDYWWSSLKKVNAVLPDSIQIIRNNAISWGEYSIGGARLWDTAEYNFSDIVNFQENPRAKAISDIESDPEKIFARELDRLELSLKCLDQRAKKRLIMTHYPPVSTSLADSRATALLEKYGVDVCVFGHLHNVTPLSPHFGEKNGIQYYLTSCDYLDFKPIRVAE